MCAARETHPRLALSPPLHTVGEKIEVATLPLGQERVPQLQHVAVHYAVLSQRVVCTRTQTQSEHHLRTYSPSVMVVFRAVSFTLLMAELLVLRPLASLILVRV